MPGPYRVMEDCMGGIKERWAGGMYAAPTEETVRMVAGKDTQ